MKLTTELTLYGTLQVCRLLGARETVVQDAVRRFMRPQPRIVGRGRVWTEADVQRLRDVLEERGVVLAEAE